MVFSGGEKLHQSVRDLVAQPAWLTIKARTREPQLVTTMIAALYRAGYPHVRFARLSAKDAETTTKNIFLGGWEGDVVERPLDVWVRFVRAYAGNVTKLSSDPRKRALTPEATKAISGKGTVDDDVPDPEALVRTLMSAPATLRRRRFTEDFFYALELMFGAERVANAIVSVLVKPPPGKALPQMKALTDDVALALGFLRLRLPTAKVRKTLDARLTEALAVKSTRYPIPKAAIRAFLEPPSEREVLAFLRAFEPADDPLSLLDSRLVFLAGEDAIPIYLEKFVAYERALHPNVVARQLVAFVDAIAPFRDARVTTWLESLVKHRHVGREAKAWLAIPR